MEDDLHGTYRSGRITMMMTMMSVAADRESPRPPKQTNTDSALVQIVL